MNTLKSTWETSCLLVFSVGLVIFIIIAGGSKAPDDAFADPALDS